MPSDSLTNGVVGRTWVLGSWVRISPSTNTKRLRLPALSELYVSGVARGCAPAVKGEEPPRADPPVSLLGSAPTFSLPEAVVGGEYASAKLTLVRGLSGVVVPCTLKEKLPSLQKTKALYQIGVHDRQRNNSKAARGSGQRHGWCLWWVRNNNQAVRGTKRTKSGRWGLPLEGFRKPANIIRPTLARTVDETRVLRR